MKVEPIAAIIILVTLAVVAGLLLPVFVFDRYFDYAHRYPPRDANAGNVFAAVAGEYTLGDGYERWALSILPDGRYSFRWSGCMGVYHPESGSVKRVGDYLALSPSEPTAQLDSRVFLPVKWDRRTYLIPPEKLEQFCDEIIKGVEPRGADSLGDFYVLGVENRVSGVPDLPKECADYLRTRLLVGRVVPATAR